MRAQWTYRWQLAAMLVSFCTTAPAALNSMADGFADYARVVEVGCNFDSRPGREFQFPSADPVLQPYGYVLWRTRPSVLANPLDYSLHLGRRGKLSGEAIMRDGVVWFEGVLDDCSRVYAEDASANASKDSLEHLSFHSKVYFSDTYAAAQNLIGHDVIVRGEGLEPNQRLYTSQRGHYFALTDRQALKVLGIDTHRYAHAKGVGPFFLWVQNAEGQQGLIKFNPDYLEVPHGVLPVYQEPPARAFAMAQPVTGPGLAVSQAMPLKNGYVLNLNRFEKQSEGMQAVNELQEAGFDAALMSSGTGWTLRVAGFASERMARSMLRILASRFGWLQLESLSGNTDLAQNLGNRR